MKFHFDICSRSNRFQTMASTIAFRCMFILCVVMGLVWTELVNDNSENMIIINSDGGADDAVAILQVLKEPSVNLLAITCTYGNVPLEQACSNVLRTLELMDMADEVPVYPGCSQPIVGTATYDYYYGPDGMGNASSEYPLPNVNVKTEHAAIAIGALANLYPGKITLISLGPLTTLALAVQLDPSLPSKLKQLTMMSGSEDAEGNVSPVAEFNIFDDPVSAQTVISAYSAGCHITVMTWDMCEEYTASWSWYNNWISTNSTEAQFISNIFEMANEKNMETNQTFQCCDLQATTAVLYPQVVNDTDSEFVQVELCGQLTKGEFVVDYRSPSSKSPNIEFYSTLNKQIMLDLWDDITGINPDNSTANATDNDLDDGITTDASSNSTDSLGV